MQRKAGSFKYGDDDYTCKDLIFYVLDKGPFASALCYTQDGKLLVGRSYYFHPDFSGHISNVNPVSLEDIHGTLSRIPAKALCSTPDGKLLVGNCDYSTSRICVVGRIEVFDATSRQWIKTLINEPASALCYRADGYLLASTCYADHDLSVKGSIVIRDVASGEYIKTLIDEPASALCYLPDGHLLTSTCYVSVGVNVLQGDIVIRDPLSGQRMRALCNQPTPASAMCLTPDNHLLMSAYHQDLGTGTGVSVMHWCRNQALYRQSQQTFVNLAIEIARACSAAIENKAQPHFAIFPMEIIFMIILECGKKTLGMDDEDVFQCFKLILENFQIRRHIMTKGEYDPLSMPKEGIYTWWSQVTRDKEERKIFRTPSPYNATLFKPPPSKLIEKKITHHEDKKKKHHRKCVVM